MLIMVLDESFQRLNKKADIEREVKGHTNCYQEAAILPA